MPQILTTHAGSLPRPEAVVKLLFQRERDGTYDVAKFDAGMAEAVAEAVRRQVEAGVGVVSDGEMSKISYATYVKDRYEGFTGDSPRRPPADLAQFPSFLKRLAESGGTPSYSRPQCTSEVRSKGLTEVCRDVENLKAAMAQHGVERGFLNAASPGVIALFLPNNVYPNHETYLAALADAMKPEYEAIVSAGLDLQLDCPDLGLSRHMQFVDLSDDEFVKQAELHLEMLNHALRDTDPDRVRVHACWGNYEGPHTCDIGMDRLFGVLMKARCRYLLFEASNPRHAHEWTVFRDRRSEIPDDKILVPGVLDTTTNFVEHPELVAERLARFASIIGADRIMAGTDCGFGTFAGYGAVDGEIAYEKLRAQAEGAALASARLGS